MKKRIVALSLAVLTLVLALGFAGCKKNDKTDWDYIADKGELVIGITYFRTIWRTASLSASRQSLLRPSARSSA